MKTERSINSGGASLTTLLVVATLGLAAWAAYAHRVHLALAADQQTLQAQLSQVNTDGINAPVPEFAAAVQADGDTSRSDLLRLRGEVAMLRREAAGLDQARRENRLAGGDGENGLAHAATPAKATADYWPRDAWRFAGFATPGDALQSSIWAANNGDLQQFINSITGEMHDVIAKTLGDKPAPEAAVRAMDEVASLKSVHIVNRETLNADTTVLTVEFEDSEHTSTEKITAKLVGNEWKLSGKPD